MCVDRPERVAGFYSACLILRCQSIKLMVGSVIMSWQFALTVYWRCACRGGGQVTVWTLYSVTHGIIQVLMLPGHQTPLRYNWPSRMVPFILSQDRPVGLLLRLKGHVSGLPSYTKDTYLGRLCQYDIWVNGDTNWPSRIFGRQLSSVHIIREQQWVYSRLVNYTNLTF